MYSRSSPTLSPFFSGAYTPVGRDILAVMFPALPFDTTTLPTGSTASRTLSAQPCFTRILSGRSSGMGGEVIIYPSKPMSSSSFASAMAISSSGQSITAVTKQISSRLAPSAAKYPDDGPVPHLKPTEPLYLWPIRLAVTSCTSPPFSSSMREVNISVSSLCFESSHSSRAASWAVVY